MAFELPALPYEYDALEPSISEETMRLHHGIHHAGYTNKLNKAIIGTQWEGTSIEDLLRKVDTLPVDVQLAVQQSGGGYANHSLFWRIMAPDAGGTPEGTFGDVMYDRFDGFDKFKALFEQVSCSHFGVGWGWLVVDEEGDLEVYSLENQDSPLMKGHIPILCVDVWEHAYYKQYGPHRLDYVSNWWNVVNWPEVSRLYDNALRRLAG